METKEIKEKSASELNEEILDIDTRNLQVREEINRLVEQSEDIYSLAVNTVVTNKDLKNERERKSELEKILKTNSEYQTLKEQINVLKIQKDSQENRKKFLERGYKISLNENKNLAEYLYSANERINKLDKERIEKEERFEKIQKEMGERRDELSKKIVQRQDRYKNDEEKNKAFIELLQKDESLKKLQNEIQEINNRLKNIVSERQYMERKIKIEAIIKGVRI